MNAYTKSDKSNKAVTLPKLIIFDMDGLIFNTEQLFMDKKAPILEKYGFIARKEDYVRTLGTAGATLDKIHKEIYGPTYDTEKINVETRAAVNVHIDEYGVEIKPGIRELLIALNKHHISCCVASSSKADTVTKYLKQADIFKYFEYIYGGDDVTHSKPNPEIFLKAWGRKGNVLKEDTIIFEDSENGILAAKNAEIPVYCIPDLKYPDEEMATIPIKIFENAFDVIEYFSL